MEDEEGFPPSAGAQEWQHEAHENWGDYVFLCGENGEEPTPEGFEAALADDGDDGTDSPDGEHEADEAEESGTWEDF